MLQIKNIFEDLLANSVTFVQSLMGKQDKLTPGANITIDKNNVISAEGGGSPLPDNVVIYSDEEPTDTQLEEPIYKSDVINNLVSTDNESPLSANMGRELKSEIEDNKLRLGKVFEVSDVSNLSEGITSIFVASGTQIGQSTAPNNLRGIAIRHNNVVIAFVSSYNGTQSYILARDGGSDWIYANKITTVSI